MAWAVCSWTGSPCRNSRVGYHRSQTRNSTRSVDILGQDSWHTSHTLPWHHNWIGSLFRSIWARNHTSRQVHSRPCSSMVFQGHKCSHLGRRQMHLRLPEDEVLLELEDSLEKRPGRYPMIGHVWPGERDGEDVRERPNQVPLRKGQGRVRNIITKTEQRRGSTVSQSWWKAKRK